MITNYGRISQLRHKKHKPLRKRQIHLKTKTQRQKQTHSLSNQNECKLQSGRHV